MRAAWFFLRNGRTDRAKSWLDRITTPPPDLRVRYLLGLLRGEFLRAQGDHVGAAAAFRDALSAYPDASTARVALMTALVAAGDRQEAEAQALRAQTPVSGVFDPWWSYWLGDIAEYPARLDRLRELAR